MGTSPFVARMVARFLGSDFFDKHLGKVIAIYRKKRDALDSALREYCPEEFSWSKPAGGFFLWLDVLSGRDGVSLLRRGYEEGVSFVPGGSFYHDKPDKNKVRLAYSYLSLQDIEEGAKRLGKALAKASRQS